MVPGMESCLQFQLRNDLLHKFGNLISIPGLQNYSQAVLWRSYGRLLRVMNIFKVQWIIWSHITLRVAHTDSLQFPAAETSQSETIKYRWLLYEACAQSRTRRVIVKTTPPWNLGSA